MRVQLACSMWIVLTSAKHPPTHPIFDLAFTPEEPEPPIALSLG
jgi:hypothetical protein